MNEPAESTNSRAPHTRLWVAILVVAAVASVLLIVVLGQWWPSGSGWYLPAGMALAFLTVTAAAWVIDSIYILWKRRRWAWWMLAWPIVVAVGVILAFAVRPEFDDARPEFEGFVHHLLASGETASWSDMRIGRFDVDGAYSTAKGEVFFVDARTSGFTTESGWVYSPDGAPTPPRDGEFSTVHLDGPWYRYTRVITF